MGVFADVALDGVFFEVAEDSGGGGAGTITAVVAGAGLTGGGVTGSVTVNVGAGTGITVNANDVAVDTTVIATIAYVDAAVAASGDITGVTAGAGLTGGGSTGAVTVTVGAGTGITVNADDVAVDTTVIATIAYVDAAVAASGDITGVTAGAGLTGGGATGAVTVAVGAGTGITVNADDVAVDQAFTPTWTGAHVFQQSDAARNTVLRTTLRRLTTDALHAQAGLGVGVSYELEDDTSDTAVEAGRVDCIWIDPATASKDSAFTWSVQVADTLTELMRLGGATHTLEVLPNADATFCFGRLRVANWAADHAYLGHFDHNTSTTDFGLRFDPDGDTYLKAPGANASLSLVAGDSGTSSLTFGTNNTTRWSINSSGHLVTGADNTYDIGTTSATRPATIHAGTQINAPIINGNGSLRIGGNSLTLSASSTAVDFSLSNSRYGYTFSGTTSAATGAVQSFRYLPMSHTNQTASTEITSVEWRTFTRQWATGAITTQREFLITAPTYSFVGASVVATAATFAISGAPIAGTNATLTKALGLWVQGGLTQLDGRLIAAAPDSAIADADMPVSSYSAYLNEAGNTLTFKAKYAGGTVKTGTVALT